MALIVKLSGDNTITGTNSSDHIYTGSGNDTISALQGNNVISAGDGNNRVTSGSGSDLIVTGSGADVIDAGGGNDTVLSGLGNDVFIHRLAENVGARDYYDGSLGSDTLRLNLSSAEWARADVQADIAAFLNAQQTCINQILNPLGLSSAFTFKSMNLTVVNIEKLEVVVEGVAIDPRNEGVTAQADSLSVTEDAGGSINLLANDLVPDRARSVTLLTPSTLGTLSLVPTLSGAQQTATLSFTPSAALQSLKAGEERTETLTYEVVDVNGDRSTSTVTIKVVGVNDAATIAVDSTVAADTAVTEAGGVANGTSGDAVASGKLLISDVDTGEAKLATGGAIASQYGTFTLDAATGQWSYTLDAAKSDSLAEGQSAQDKITVTSADGTASYDIAVSITGKNDAATIAVNAGVADDRAVVEGGEAIAGDASAAGKLAVSDADTGEAKFQTPASLAGTYGTFTFNAATGAWTYQLDPSTSDALTAGEQAQDTLTVLSHDGTASHDIVVQITGSNDAATVSVDATVTDDRAVTESGEAIAGDASASGKLVVADVDTGEAKFQTPASLAGTYGTFTFNAATGAWTYQLDPSKSDALTAGEQTQDKITVLSHDGTASHDIVVQITGSNDKASITVDATVTNDRTVTESGFGVAGDASASGKLVVSDVDAGEANFQAPAVAALAGTYGTFTFNVATGEWTYQLDQTKVDTLAANEHVQDTLTITSQDGTASHDIVVDITGTNDAPVVTGAVSGAVDARAAVSTLNALEGASDIDNNTTLSVVDVPTTLPAGVTYNAVTHTFSLDPSNAVYTALPSGQTKTVIVNYGISDGTATTTQTISWVVTGTNHAPEVVANAPSSFTGAAGNLNTDANFDLDLSTIFTDADGDTLNYTIAGLPQGFSLVNGVLTQTSATTLTGFGDSVLTITADDGNGGSTTTSVTLTVALKNDYGNAYSFANTTRTVSATSADDTLNFGTSAGAASGLLTVSSGAGNDTISFGQGAGGNGSVSADGGDGDDKISFGVNSGFAFGSVTAIGGAGNDTITFADFVGVNNGTVTVKAGTGADKIAFGNGAAITGNSIQIDLGQNDLSSDLLTLLGSAKATITSFEVGTDKIDLNVNANMLTMTENGNDVRISGSGIDITLKDVGTGHTLSELLVEKPWAAVIGNASATDVTEDTNVVFNQLTAKGTIAITDLNPGEAAFKIGSGDIGVSGDQWYASGSQAIGGSSWGQLRMQADGSYTYSVQNSSARVQALGENETHTDTFTVTAADGTTKTLSFTIRGASDNQAPEVVANAPTSFTAAAGNQTASQPFALDLNSQFADTDGDSLTFSVSGAGAEEFAIVNGVLQLVDGSDPSSAGNYSLEVTADDNKGGRTTSTIDVAIALVHDYGFKAKAIDESGSSLNDNVTFGMYSGFNSTSVRVKGGDGDDTFSFAEHAGDMGFAAAYGDAGNDKISVGNIAGIINGTFVADGGDGNDTISIGNNFGSDGTGTAIGGAGEDVILIGRNAGEIGGSVNAQGGDGNDTINFGSSAGFAGRATADGGEGDDHISLGSNAGASGSLLVDGGEGDDEIAFGRDAGFGKGLVTVNGGVGNDHITFGTDAANGGTINVATGSGADTVAFETGVGANLPTRNGAVNIDLGSADGAADKVVFSGSVINASVTSFEVGTDKIDLNVNANTLVMTQSGQDVRITSTAATGTPIDITIKDVGTGHSLAEFLVAKPWAAVIGNATNTSVTEDANVVNNKLTATGSIAITDINAGEASFLTTVAAAAGNLGTLTLAADGSYTYAVDNAAVQYLGAGKTKVDTFTVTATDGTTKTVSFTINGVNDAPVAGNDGAQVSGDRVLSVTAANGLLANDSDLDSTPGLQVVSRPNLQSSTADTDGDGIKDNVDNSPLVKNANQIDADGDGVGDASDPDRFTVGDAREVAVTIGVAQQLADGSTLTVNADGSYTFDPTGSSKFKNMLVTQTATETFYYVVQDAAGATSSAKATITVNGTNHAPVYTGPAVLNGGAAGNLATAAQTQNVSINLPSLFTDPDGNSITIAPMNLPVQFGGSPTLNNQWIGQMPSNYAGDNTLSITASDGKGGVTTQQVTLSIALEQDFGTGTPAAQLSFSSSISGSSLADTLKFGSFAVFSPTASVNTGAGDDKISFGGYAGYLSSVNVDAGGGNDSITFAEHVGHVGSAVVNGGAGNDTIKFGENAGYTGSLTVVAGSGGDQIQFATGAGLFSNVGVAIDLGLNDGAADTLSFLGSAKSVITGFEIGTDQLVFAANPNTLTFTDSGDDVHITGSGIDVWLNDVGPGYSANDFFLV